MSAGATRGESAGPSAGEGRPPTRPSAPDVIAITDPALADDDLADRAKRMLARVPRSSLGLQLRDKGRPGAAVVALAERLARICAEFGAPFYVNDRVDIALATGADGIHLGAMSIGAADARRLLGDRSFVSIAAHGLDDLDRAMADGATAALLSPVFATPAKGPPRGTGFIAEARARAPRLRLYALGGVDPGSAPSCVDHGADGVAAIRALWHAPDPGAAASALVDAVRERRR